MQLSFWSRCKRNMCAAAFAMVIVLFTSGAKKPLEVKAGDDIQTVCERYEKAGAKRVKIPLAAPEVDSVPNQTEPSRRYEYVVYEYKGETLLIYYLDGKVTSIVEYN